MIYIMICHDTLDPDQDLLPFRTIKPAEFHNGCCRLSGVHISLLIGFPYDSETGS